MAKGIGHKFLLCRCATFFNYDLKVGGPRGVGYGICKIKIATEVAEDTEIFSVDCADLYGFLWNDSSDPGQSAKLHVFNGTMMVEKKGEEDQELNLQWVW